MIGSGDLVIREHEGGGSIRRLRSWSRAAGEARLGCMLWIAFVALTAYVGYKFGSVKFASSQFEDVMTEQAAFASNRGNGLMMETILAKAKELRLPIGKDEVLITRTRESITVEAHYAVDVELFGGLWKYRWVFDPVVQRPVYMS